MDINVLINELMVSAISASESWAGFGGGHAWSGRGDVLQQALDDGFHGNGFSLGPVVGQNTVPEGGMAIALTSSIRTCDRSSNRARTLAPSTMN